MSGIFTISLDFELHWGGFEKWPLPDYHNYFMTTRRVIPDLLKVFEMYEIHATWATVGMLFFGNRKDLTDNFPDQQPGYINKNLSAYNFIETHGIGDSEETDPFHFGGSLVLKINQTPFQEIGSHSFAHYYCNEPGQNPDQFREDLKTAQRVALKKLGRKMRSLVFPRNQFNEHYLQVCYEEGFEAVRDNPIDWFWQIRSTQREAMWKRLNRGLDAYFPIGKKNTYLLSSLTRREGSPVCLPASRLLRPYRPGELFLNELKVRRICKEIERAAANGEVYHLWWHPHNFGNFPDENFRGLERVLEVVATCRQRYGMTCLTMSETVDKITES